MAILQKSGEGLVKGGVGMSHLSIAINWIALYLVSFSCFMNVEIMEEVSLDFVGVQRGVFSIVANQA